jgi:protein-S-isoprenylcysteine O-methyltransferase Ste14
MLPMLLVLSLPVTAIALLYARREYRVRGRLSPLGLLLLCAMILIPNLMLEYATRYQWPSTPLDYLGVMIGVMGLAVCITGMASFNSLQKVLCIETGQLADSVIYRWSRNPQYLGWFLFLLGFALNDWSWWCLIALMVSAVSLHLLVLVEEEHLRKHFGDAYARFCDEVPRYFRTGLAG